MEEYSPFSTSLPACAVPLVFDLSHPDWFKVESLGCFDLHFSDEYYFKSFSDIQDSSVENSLFSSLPHFLIGVFVCLFFFF